MEPHVSLDERLNQILTSFAKWHGDSEEAGPFDGSQCSGHSSHAGRRTEP